jgi:protein-disulfide isomerase
MKASGETKLLVILGLIVLLGVGALFLLSKGTDGPGGKPTPAPEVKMDGAAYDALVKDARHVKEDPGAEVTIVEFADFECGSCRRTYQGSLSKLLNDPKRPVKLVFRHFPLDTEHPFATPAAIASEAAAKQGKFWEMYAALFDRTAEELLDAERIKASAKKAGLDMARYENDVKDPALAKLVADDKQLAERNQIVYTPTFMIRDKSGNITSAVGDDGLQKAMDDIFGGASAKPAPAGGAAAPGASPAPVPAAPGPKAP